MVAGCDEVELTRAGSGRLDGRHARELDGDVVRFGREADVLAEETPVVHERTGTLVLMLEADLEPA